MNNQNEEEAFMLQAENNVKTIAKLWHNKEGLIGYATMGLSAQLEDLIYNEAMKEHKMPTSSAVWTKKECIDSYQNICDKLINSLETKELNWKKLFDENKSNAKYVLQALLKTENEKKFKKANQKQQNESEVGSSGRIAPKARKSHTMAGRGRGRGPKGRKSKVKTESFSAPEQINQLESIQPYEKMGDEIQEDPLAALYQPAHFVESGEAQPSEDIGGFDLDFDFDFAQEDAQMSLDESMLEGWKT